MKYRCAIFCLVFICTSCSLEYLEKERQTDGIPEFVFSDARCVRFQNGIVSAEIDAQRLEQYRNDGALYGRGVVFKTYTGTGELSAEGGCALLAADASAERYTLLKDISIVAHEQQLTIRAENMQWDGKSEQLVCGEDDEVSVSRTQRASPQSSGSEIRLTGRSLSASGVSRSYSFAEPVSGTIYVSDAAEGGER